MSCCCCCLPTLQENLRTIDEHVPLSTQQGNTTIYTTPLSPPIPLVVPPRNPQIQTHSSQEARGTTDFVPEKTTNSVQEKETWPVSDLTDLDIKKKIRELIDECPICLEEYEIENPKLITKCNHGFHLACILAWMERSEVCPVCDKELVITEP